MGATAAAQARARLGIAFELASAGRGDQALSVFDEVVAGFGGKADPEVRFEVAKALDGRASVLRQLDRLDDAVASLDEVLRLATLLPSGVLDELAAPAAFDRSWILEASGRSRAALAGYQQVADRFGDDPRPPLREAVARSLVNRATMLGYLQGAEDAVHAFDEVLERFEDAGEPGVRQALELARQHRALLAGGGDLDLRSPQEDPQLSTTLLGTTARALARSSGGETADYAGM